MSYPAPDRPMTTRSPAPAAKVLRLTQGRRTTSPSTSSDVLGLDFQRVEPRPVARIARLRGQVVQEVPAGRAGRPSSERRPDVAVGDRRPTRRGNRPSARRGRSARWTVLYAHRSWVKFVCQSPSQRLGNAFGDVRMLGDRRARRARGPGPGSSDRTNSPSRIGFQPPTRSLRQGTSNSANASWIRKLGVLTSKCRQAARATGPIEQCGATRRSCDRGHRGDLLARRGCRRSGPGPSARRRRRGARSAGRSRPGCRAARPAAIGHATDRLTSASRSRHSGRDRLLAPGRVEPLEPADHRDRRARRRAGRGTRSSGRRRGPTASRTAATMSTAASASSRRQLLPGGAERVELRARDSRARRPRAPARRTRPACAPRRTSRWRRPAIGRGSGRRAAGRPAGRTPCRSGPSSAISTPLMAVMTVEPPWYWSRIMPPTIASMSNGSRPRTRPSTHSWASVWTVFSCHSSVASPTPGQAGVGAQADEQVVPQPGVGQEGLELE